MAHQIFRNSMAYVGTKPWHDVGTALPAGAGIPEMITAAKLDWRVNLAQLQMADGTLVDRWAVVRSGDSAVLGTVGARYVPLQNADAFKWFAPFLESGMASLETAGALFSGERVWVLAKLNRPADVIVAKTADVVDSYILITHAHDGSASIVGGWTPERAVCQNTLSVALTAGASTMIKIRHTASAKGALAAAQDAMVQADNAFGKAADVFRALAGKRFSNAQLTTYLRALFPSTAKPTKPADVVSQDFASLLSRPANLSTDVAQDMAERVTSRAHDAILEILESGGRNGDLRNPAINGTAWSAYNAVTEYLTHDHGRTVDSRLSNLWFGNVSGKALQLAASTFLAS